MKKFEVLTSENNEGIFIVNPLGDKVLEVLWHGSVEEQEDFAMNVATLLNKAEYKKRQSGLVTVADVVDIAERMEDGGKEVTTKMVNDVLEYFPECHADEPNTPWDVIIETLLWNEICEARRLSNAK